MTGTMEGTVITVQGSHSVTHAAEEAHVRLAVEQQGPAREAVLAAVTEAAAALQAELEGQPGSTLLRWTTSGLRAWSERPWSQDGVVLPLVQHARVDLTAVFVDFAALSLWLDSAAAREGVVVDGVEWRLAEDSAIAKRADAQQAAVADAVSRATAFASSLGLATLRPLALADPGMLGEVGESASPGVFRGKAMLAMADTSGGSGVSFRPEEIRITAAVDARFLAG